MTVSVDVDVYCVCVQRCVHDCVCAVLMLVVCGCVAMVEWAEG